MKPILNSGRNCLRKRLDFLFGLATSTRHGAESLYKFGLMRRIPVSPTKFSTFPDNGYPVTGLPVIFVFAL